MILWAIWVVASIFYAYQYVLRVMPSIMLNEIMLQFRIDATTFGQFSGIYYIGYSLMHLPIGIMLDRYGPRKIMAICILLTVTGLSPLIFATHWSYPIIGRFLIGMGSSAAILGVFKIIRMTFKEKLFARMVSFSVTIGLIGAIYGGGPVNYMCAVFGYQTVIYIFAAAGILLALATYLVIPNIATHSETTVLSDIKEVLGNSKVLLSCFCAGLMVGPLEGFADVWGRTFLTQVWGFDGAIASKLPSLIFIGMCFGSPLLTFIAEKVRSHLLTILSAGVVMTIAFILLLTSSLTSSLLSLNFVVVGVCCAYQILAIYKASTYVREEVAGLTTAVANMIIMIFGYLFHTIIGGIVDLMGGPTSSQGLFYAITVIPIALFLGASGFLVLFIREKRIEKRGDLLI
jgi:predicted MFS family arabinose efflux permease